MRITNRMMTNNMLYNITSNKNQISNLEEQYATGLAIQRPSDDPIVAVRALKLRTNLTELTQYVDKNIPDAKSWMETTESALRTTSEIITKIRTYCVQGANDTFTEEDRNKIAANLSSLKEQIYQEGNANYAGRYLFTGYKTNTSLVFGETEENLEYTLTETIKADELEIGERIADCCNFNDFDFDDYESFDTDTRPCSTTVYRIRLSYDDLKRVEKGGGLLLGIPQLDEKGNYLYDDDGNQVFSEELTDADMNVCNSTDSRAYMPEPDAINYLEDTGELILGSEYYNKWRESDFVLTYSKNRFRKNELRPEHYFDCTVKDLTIEDSDERDEKAIHYEVQDQRIKYELNFSQQLHINVQGRDAFTHSVGRMIDDLVKAVSDVMTVQDQIDRVNQELSDISLSEGHVTKLKAVIEVLNTEFKLKSGVMQSEFERGIKNMSIEEDRVNVAVADIGTRYNRIELTESRLSAQKVEFTDLLSQNEDADIAETIVNYNAMNTIYNASLSAAGKVVKNTLLDFL